MLKVWLRAGVVDCDVVQKVVWGKCGDGSGEVEEQKINHAAEAGRKSVAYEACGSNNIQSAACCALGETRYCQPKP